ncbi:ubiquinol-cytochrome C chaperone family protein [Falsiroseomonas sp.]|uniref:ubiquinol-cytochrome C chaperone family protein n=1 Tax=Falsiroseomonas sp. TaxID=2870721 RepID=UPI0034A403C0
MAEALARNVWRGEAPDGAAERLAALVAEADALLAAQPFDALVTGEVRFPSVPA